jgi:hypothetical protein
LADGLVVAGGVEDQFAEQLAGGGVDDADVAVGDEQQDVGAGVGSSDADVVQPAVVAQGDDTGVVDAVAADPLVAWCVGGGGGGGGGFWAGGVGRSGGAPVEGTVRAVGVVVGGEPVE